MSSDMSVFVPQRMLLLTEDVFVGLTYLDHAGATLYAQQQVICTMKDLSENVYGNPHSRSECSQRTTELVDLVRSRSSVMIHHLSSSSLITLCSTVNGLLFVCCHTHIVSAFAQFSHGTCWK